MVEDDDEIKEFVSLLDSPERLKPRDAFFGGRTCPYTLHHKVEPGEEIHYYDFTSLYPWVNKYCCYPVGHPEVIMRPPIDNFDQYFGVAKIDVLPPRKIYFPVLPIRNEGKLVFPLCRTCAVNSTPNCSCSDEDRMLTGTWCTPEIKLALSKGYKLAKVYEVYHFKQTAQYDPETRTGGLFDEYVNTFLKIKQQASGWPRQDMTEEEKEHYIKQYEQKEGVKLDPSQIQKNPGLRSLAKLCLNSFWGKFGQSETQSKTSYISDASEFYKIMTDPTKTVKDFRLLNEQMIRLEHETDEEWCTPSSFKNIFIACMTTTYARMKLYTVLDQLQTRALYSDTDSVIFTCKAGEEMPSLGDFLGELTSELNHDDHIVEFVSTGPKAYAYVTEKGQTSVKLKGFSLNYILNYINSQKIHFESMRQNILFDRQTIEILETNKICRDKNTLKIYNVSQSKKYGMVYDKRVLHKDLTTTPYGY
jgi:hypothetical protein